MKMYLAGEWIETADTIEVRHPFDGAVVDTVPRAGGVEVERALAAAVHGAAAMARLSAAERYQILQTAAAKLAGQAEAFARTITMEEGKVLAESRAEVARAVETLTVSAEEAKRIHGETVPLDAQPGTVGKFGFTLRVPCGVVVAISPFNFPLNLVAHKVGPALAAGNAVIIKPPSATPLSALRLTALLLESRLPPQGIACLTGSGAQVGEALCRDRRVRKISFTGSRAVGEHLCQVAGLKRVTMELGSNSAILVLADADIEKAATAIAATGYSNAGQVCISTQRVLAARPVYADLLAATEPKVTKLRTGNPLDETVQVGPMITEQEAIRIEQWVAEAQAGGARVVTGGARQGAVYAPTILAEVTPQMRVACEELFGPAVAVTPVADLTEALALANDSLYGLAAGVFTESLESAMQVARELVAGIVHINWGPQWRADLMPYGGLKDSGFGKEGPRYAIEEMTELKMICLHLNSEKSGKKSGKY